MLAQYLVVGFHGLRVKSASHQRASRSRHVRFPLRAEALLQYPNSIFDTSDTRLKIYALVAAAVIFFAGNALKIFFDFLGFLQLGVQLLHLIATFILPL